MKLFEPRKDRPDIAKDAFDKKGAAKVLMVLWREFFGLIKLNLLFILTCIPIITIPASITAMSRITCVMVRNENYFLWNDYIKAFKRDFLNSLFGGLVLFVFMGIFSLSAYFYLNIFGMSKLSILLAACSLCLLFAALFASFWFFPMLATVEAPLKVCLKNSLIIAFRKMGRTLLAFAAFLFFFVSGILLWPSSLVYVVFIMFSLSSLMIALAVYPSINELILLNAAPIAGEEPTDNAEGELQSAAAFDWDDDITPEIPGEEEK